MIGDSYNGPISKPFDNINPLFDNKSDIIINLETAVSDNNYSSNLQKTYIYKINSSVLKELQKWKIGIVNLANNHIMDYELYGFDDTINTLIKHNFSYFGAGQNLNLSRKGLIKKYDNGLRIGYLGYFEYRSIYDYKYRFYAKENRPGVADLSYINLNEDIQRLKKDSDIIIVSIHIGQNYDINISNTQKNYSRYAIECGADAIICHSAHIALPFEFYNNKPIFYSIGNFIFTTPGRFRYVDEVYHVGLGVKFVFNSNNIKYIDIIPFKTNNKLTNYQPIFLNNNETKTLFNTILSSNKDLTIYDYYARIDTLN